jgi:formylmethanofuran dehydrogenase subunit B
MTPHHAVSGLTRARRVLVTGLVGSSPDAAVAACDLAEAIGAAIDFGQPDLARPAGPTIARAGEVTAAEQEMRDRADLVILWGCDPAVSRPALAASLPETANILPIPARGEEAVDMAGLLVHLLRGGEPPAAGGPAVATCIAARAAIAVASCVAIVTDDAADPLGLEAWSVVHLMRTIAHEKPAFEIPLRAGDHGAAAAVCTWRYGAAGAIARADRAGGRFLPAEASARHLVDRGEVDCVVVIGRASDDVAAAITARGDAVAVIRIADDPAVLQEFTAAVTIHIQGPRA